MCVGEREEGGGGQANLSQTTRRLHTNHPTVTQPGKFHKRSLTRHRNCLLGTVGPTVAVSSASNAPNVVRPDGKAPLALDTNARYT